MAKARTSRPTPAATEGRTELEFIADRLIEKVWQGDEGKRGLATQAASVALAAIQDHTAARYMEGVNEHWFDGRDLMNFWVNRDMLREARASVALDKGDGETQSVEGAFTGTVVEHEAAWTVAPGRSVYRCTRSWPDGTQCDQISAQSAHTVHRRVVRND